jgi:hypothetical protein
MHPNWNLSEDRLVEPLFERESDSVPGPFYVIKDRGLICALPVETAPANVTWRMCDGCPDRCRVERQPESAPELEAMIEVVRGSCVDAYRYCGADAYVLKKLSELGLGRLCDALVHANPVLREQIK